MIKKGQHLYHVSRNGAIRIVEVKEDENDNLSLVHVYGGQDETVNSNQLSATLGRAVVMAMQTNNQKRV